MRLAKLRFVHRRLWQRDGTYRIAVLLGPAPLLGAGLAAMVWFGAQAVPAKPVAPPPWAMASGPRHSAAATAPRAVAPGMQLPASGLPPNMVTGWQGGIQPVEIDATMDVNVLPTRLAPLVFDKPSLELGRIMAAGPHTGRFVGTGFASLVVRTAGIHALSLRLEREDPDPVACLERLAFANQRLVSNLELNTVGPSTTSSEPVSFELQPGLYPISIAFGCWDDQREKGSATLSVLIRPPGEPALRPARTDELLRTATPQPTR